MKIKIVCLFLLFTILKSSNAITFNEINNNWQFRQVGTLEWLPATVPGSIFDDLIANEKIARPSLDEYNKISQWVETKDWEYQTTFNTNRYLALNKEITLLLEGIDTFADVYLNDELIASCNNMFMSYELVLRPDLLKEDDNKLHIVFHSTVKSLTKEALKNIFYPPFTDFSNLKVSPLVRKPMAQFGSEVSPRMVGVGIWKPIKLVYNNTLHILSANVETLSLDSSKANLLVKVNIQSTIEQKINVSLQGTRFQSFDFKAEKKIITIPIEVANPQLWWTHDQGEPYLYDTKIRISNDMQEEDVLEQSFGIRKVELVTEEDSLGKSFFIRLNNKPLFIKGTTYLPNNITNAKIKKEYYTALFENIKKSNINLIRVWGGSIYEDDEFYAQADKNGILIWQDLPFAENMYPSSDSFINNIQNEIKSNVERLQHHPSLGLWCGNYKSGINLKKHFWESSYTLAPEDESSLYNDYLRVFEQVIPSTLKEIDSVRVYLPTSPNALGETNDELKNGENCYFNIPDKQEPFDSYQIHVPRFLNGFGFPSVPNMLSSSSHSSITRYIGTLKNRNKSRIRLLDHYIDLYYPKPTNVEKYVYTTQLLQAEALKTAIVSCRKYSPYCMGTIYWHFNENTLDVSNACLDYYGRWKPAQYAIRKAFSPTILIGSVKNDRIDVRLSLHSPLDNTKKYKVIVKIQSFKGDSIWQKEYDVKISGYGKTIHILKENIPVLDKINTRNSVINLILHDGESIVANEDIYLAPFKMLDLQEPKILDRCFSSGKGIVSIELKSDILVKNLSLSIDDNEVHHFSDNYFDLMPNEEVVVDIQTHLSAEEVNDKLRFFLLYH